MEAGDEHDDWRGTGQVKCVSEGGCGVVSAGGRSVKQTAPRARFERIEYIGLLLTAVDRLGRRGLKFIVPSV